MNLDYGLGLPSAFSIPEESYQSQYGIFFLPYNVVKCSFTTFNFITAKYADDHTNAVIWPTLLRPKSRGNLRLKSSDPEDHPIITSGYLEHPHDVKTMVEAMKHAYSVKVGI